MWRTEDIMLKNTDITYAYREEMDYKLQLFNLITIVLYIINV